MRFVMLCKNCPQCKTVGVGDICTRSWCKLSKPDAAGKIKRKLQGVILWECLY